MTEYLLKNKSDIAVLQKEVTSLEYRWQGEINEENHIQSNTSGRGITEQKRDICILISIGYTCSERKIVVKVC